MSSDFTIEFRNNYLLVKHPQGYEINPETSARFWAALTSACRTHKCYRILREGKNITRKMNMADSYRSAEMAAAAIPGLRIAFYFEGYKPDKVSDFFETAAENRGAYIRFFSHREDALRWLGVEE